MTGQRVPIVVLISGRGSNLQAIIDETRRERLSIRICAVVSNRPDASGLKRAHDARIPTQVIDHHRFATRTLFEHALIKTIDCHQPDLVVLAGFTRILSDAFIDHYAGRLLNIHPSLLPEFPGLNTHQRALESGATEHGATVHFVTRDVDAGPIIIQARVPVLPDDSPDRLAARVLEEEHRIYPLAIRWFAKGRLSMRHGTAWLDGRVQLPQSQGGR